MSRELRAETQLLREDGHSASPGYFKNRLDKRLSNIVQVKLNLSGINKGNQ